MLPALVASQLIKKKRSNRPALALRPKRDSSKSNSFSSSTSQSNKMSLLTILPNKKSVLPFYFENQNFFGIKVEFIWDVAKLLWLRCFPLKKY